MAPLKTPEAPPAPIVRVQVWLTKPVDDRSRAQQRIDEFGWLIVKFQGCTCVDHHVAVGRERIGHERFKCAAGDVGVAAVGFWYRWIGRSTYRRRI